MTMSSNGRQIKIFDTTLRDGSQGEKVSFSADDKIRIARRLDQFGIHYIEGGWPGSNPRDIAFFEKAQQVRFEHAKIVAFGSTMRAGNTPENDANLQALLATKTRAISIFGKSWLLHVEKALRISPEQNLDLIERSLSFLKAHDKEIIYDAEHFFDGYKDDPAYAIRTLQAAEKGGADILVLCDTNGGTLPEELVRIIAAVRAQVATPLGIHTHNDGEVAVANTLAAVEAGCVHVQGTINGYGERCGNANLCSIIPNLQLKLGYTCVPEENLPQLTAVSRLVSELANLAHPDYAAFVGKSAFAHKGGVHVSAVMKDARTYEHIEPEEVGNERRVLVSDLSGRSNVFYKARELGVDLEEHTSRVPAIVERLKQLEQDGYQFEAAEGSFKLLMQRILDASHNHFELEGFRVIIEKNALLPSRSEATVRLKVNGVVEHTASEGAGPVHALDRALRKALTKFYPEISEMQLSDYKVRVLNESAATGAKVRVLLDSSSADETWSTVGVSENIIEASWQALMDSFAYFLFRRNESASHPQRQTQPRETETV